jgi:hypothetical protein
MRWALGGALTEQENPNRFEDNLHVIPQRPLVDILKIEAHNLFEVVDL